MLVIFSPFGGLVSKVLKHPWVSSCRCHEQSLRHNRLVIENRSGTSAREGYGEGQWVGCWVCIFSYHLSSSPLRDLSQPQSNFNLAFPRAIRRNADRGVS